MSKSHYDINSRLCFIEPDMSWNHVWLWFIPPGITAWGDDWNDGYFPHNAGLPTQKEAFCVPVELNGYWEFESTTCSVDDINKGKYSWLIDQNNPQRCLRGGLKATLAEVIQIVKNDGGTVYVPMDVT